MNLTSDVGTVVQSPQRPEDCQAEATAFAVKNGVTLSGGGPFPFGGACVKEHGCATWWLRSPGLSDYTAALTDSDGSIWVAGGQPDFDYIGVRPALVAQF